MYVLRKSIGAWSAGTRVEFEKVEGFWVFTVFGDVVPNDLVVKRRSMQMMVPVVNSKMRRRRRKALDELTQLSQEMPGGYR